MHWLACKGIIINMAGAHHFFHAVDQVGDVIGNDIGGIIFAPMNRNANCARFARPQHIHGINDLRIILLLAVQGLWCFGGFIGFTGLHCIILPAVMA